MRELKNMMTQPFAVEHEDSFDHDDEKEEEELIDGCFIPREHISVLRKGLQIQVKEYVLQTIEHILYKYMIINGGSKANVVLNNLVKILELKSLWYK